MPLPGRVRQKSGGGVGGPVSYTHLVIGAKAPHAVAVSSATGEGLDDLAAAVEYLFPRGSEDVYKRQLWNCAAA